MNDEQTAPDVGLVLPTPLPQPAWRGNRARRERSVRLEGADLPGFAVAEADVATICLTALFRIETDRGHANLVLPLEVEVQSTPAGRRLTLRGIAHCLSVEIVVEPMSTTLSWRLAQGGVDATARANNLKALAALSGTGVLNIRDAGSGALVGQLRLAAQSWFDAELQRDLAFLSDVAVLEEWAGQHLTLPREVPADETARIAQAARIVRDRAVPLLVTGKIVARSDVRIDEADELRLGQELVVPALGHEVRLGGASGSLRVRFVSSRPDPDDPRGFITIFAPADERAGQLLWLLEAPVGRRPGPWTGTESEVEFDPEQGWHWSDADQH